MSDTRRKLLRHEKATRKLDALSRPGGGCWKKKPQRERVGKVKQESERSARES